MPSVSIFVLLLTAVAALAQAPAVDPQRPEPPPVPTVTFTFDWPSIQPNHYSVVVGSTGSAAYQSRSTESSGQQGVSGDPYMVKFTVSEPTRSRIFELARTANYFNGDFDFKKHRVAFAGTKTLAYVDAGKNYQTSYNWSQNPAIEELTTIFEGISNTQEAARRLTQLRQFDKLGLDDELKYMEDLANIHMLAEVQSIAPLLEELAADPAVMHVARQRAQRLLQLARQETASAR